MQDKPLRKLYTSLKSNNYDVPDNYESFERTLTQAGQAGAQSRRALHESLKKDNYDVPDNYDSFYKSLFTPVNSTTSMAIGSEPVKPAPQKPTRRLLLPLHSIGTTYKTCTSAACKTTTGSETSGQAYDGSTKKRLQLDGHKA